MKRWQSTLLAIAAYLTCGWASGDLLLFTLFWLYITVYAGFAGLCVLVCVKRHNLLRFARSLLIEWAHS